MHPEQPVIDAPAFGSSISARDLPPRELLDGERASGERAARESLRAQIARLERELSAIVTQSFPYLGAWAPEPRPSGGPRLQSLAELEQSRDRLAGRVQDMRARSHARADFHRRARERLERMKLEPGRYKFARLPVRDLGEAGCGVWEVRPVLGIIGMLAGWWQLKLSSGCPLGRGSRPRRGPAQKR